MIYKEYKMSFKKALFMMIAAFATAVIYADVPVDFANVVGYQNKKLLAGYSFSTPTFVDVGSDGLDIQNFKLASGAAGDQTETIQVLDTKGLLVGSYTWLNGNVGMIPGWYDYYTWELITQSIAPGSGYFMHVNADVNAKIVGGVKTNETTVTLPMGFSVYGNNVPGTISIQDIKLGGEATGDQTESIQFLNVAGQNTQTWYWLTSEGMKGIEESGWYKENESKELVPVEYTIQPGEAFLINIGVGSQATETTKTVTMTMPSAF